MHIKFFEKLNAAVLDIEAIEELKEFVFKDKNHTKKILPE